MTKKKATAKVATRSDVIRTIFKAQPDASMAQVRAALQKRGVQVSDALINKIKYGRNGKKAAGRTNGSTSSKADAIRDMFDKLGGGVRSRDVIAALARQGVIVTSAQVSTLRKSLPLRPASNGAAKSVSLNHLIAAKQLAERLGGIDMARQALANLARLVEN